MNQLEAEANWVWDPKRGDLRPKEWPKGRRPRCTKKNIEEQQVLARPGSLIHTASKTDCPRRKSRIDEREEVLERNTIDRLNSKPRKTEISLSPGRVRFLAVAGFIDNVNCLWCRRDYFAATTSKPDGG